MTDETNASTDEAITADDWGSAMAEQATTTDDWGSAMAEQTATTAQTSAQPHPF